MSSLAALDRALADGIRPDTLMTVSQWADAHRLLPRRSSAEPGPWRTSRTPYLKEIMDCMSATSDVQVVVLMKASQVGGSEAILNALGYAVDHAPGPALLVQPTDGLAKRFSRQRLEPLIRSTPRLAEKIAPARGRDSGNTILSKEFPGGILVIAGANSAVQLRSIPAMYAFLDELDGFPVDVDEEGSPLALVEARQRTFSRRKAMLVSTPTIAGKSAIERAYQDSDQRRFYVPCPECGVFQPLEFSRLTWSRLNLPPERAVYVCRACEYPIEERHKPSMLTAGEWRPEAPGRGGNVRGYHLNGLYAPLGWLGWGQIARQFVQRHRDPEQFRVFVNTVLGETFKSKGEAPEWEPLMQRRESYPIGTVPAGVVFLTAGVDVQKDRLVTEVVGWGANKESWSIDYGVIPGDTANLETGPWSALDELLNSTFLNAHGEQMQIKLLAVDSGYNTSTVYAWTKKYPLSRVIAVKGHSRGGVLIGSPNPVEVTIGGRKMKRGARCWPVATDLAKSELYGWLRLQAPADGDPHPTGYCHFPEYPEEYFRELTSEQLVAHKNRKGYIRLEWELIAGRQNHLLDCRNYARAAAALAGLDRLK